MVVGGAGGVDASGPVQSFPWRPAGEEAEVKREEQRSLTGQKAEPLGMKFTLFLSGQENRGKPFDLRDLVRKREGKVLSYTNCVTKPDCKLSEPSRGIKAKTQNRTKKPSMKIRFKPTGVPNR